MNEILDGLDGVKTIIDDVLIYQYVVERYENDKMYCSLYFDYANWKKKNLSNYPSTFLTGCSNFKSTALQYHE